MDNLALTAFLVLFLATFVFTSVDWAIRRRRLGGRIATSWPCPHCGLVNEDERRICWSCGAGVSLNEFFPEVGPGVPTAWRCARCSAWNAGGRRTCWSCSNAPKKQPKEHG